jgi:hypothetical protein
LSTAFDAPPTLARRAIHHRTPRSLGAQLLAAPLVAASGRAVVDIAARQAPYYY